jgi:hypothetical protein
VNQLPPETPPTAAVQTVTDQLRELGVNVAAIQSAPRKLDGTVEATGEYAPLGMRAKLSPMELWAAGVADGCYAYDSTIPDVAGPRTMAVEIYDESLATPAVQPSFECHRDEAGATPFTKGSPPDDSRAQPGSQGNRAIFTGDWDSDGRDEGGAIYIRQVSGGVWRLFSYRITHGSPSLRRGLRTSHLDLVTSTAANPNRVHDADATAGDFNGDGKDDVVVGYLLNTGLRLLPMPQTTPNSFNENAGPGLNALSLGAVPAGATRSLVMASGNLDLDPQLELVVLVRTLQPGVPSDGPPVGQVRALVFDNLAADGLVFSLLSDELLTYVAPGTTEVRPWLTARPVIGDLDGDGIGELAYAGIGAFPPGGNPCAPYTFVHRVHEDRAHGGGVLDTQVVHAVSPACTGNVSAPGVIYEVMAAAFDQDGDYTRELLANERVFKLVGGKLALQPQRIADFFPAMMGAGLSEATFAMATGDVNNDGRHDVLTYHTDEDVLRMRGAGSFTRTLTFSGGGDGDTYPLLAPMDSDVDGSTVLYKKGSHRVELTEPVIHAVLAAPPYDPDYGQDPLAATSSYGKSTSSSVSTETTISFTASAALGLKVGGGFGPLEFSAETKVQLDTWVDRTEGTAYTTTHTDTYQTAGRDAVVFTSFPYDVYDYEIIESNVAALKGQTMVIMLPRSPVTRIVSRTYFNARVPPGGLKIDERVLTHTPGDVRSYMTSAQKGQVKERVLAGSYGSPRFLESTRKTVGEGTTSTSTSIELAQESFYREAVGMERSASVSLTGGVVVAEFSMGEGEENAVTLSAGQSTLLEATVPSIQVDDLTQPNAVYDWGMFTYMQRLSPTGTGAGGQVFQVVNFWAE